MIIYSPERQSEIEEILREFPYSRITTQQVVYQGKVYISVRSSNLDLLKKIQDLDSINKGVEAL